MPEQAVTFDVAASMAAFGRQDAEGATKTWEDLERYDAVIAASKPQLVIECGTLAGWSALWFARRGLDVVTVDRDPRWLVPEAKAHPRISVLTGDSADPPVVDLVEHIAAGYRRVMVSLDSDHHPAHVRREIEAYADLVTPGCYLVVEDGICRWIPGAGGGGPLDAVELLLVDDPRFTEDTEVESMYPVTMHPRGWWRRV